ncbi:dimethyl sulfoxide reductase, C subunit, putative [Oceaniovalibus guishaninsula JLT2003]|uniref:Dimethyl sulfoxide reductase, C subunit, putative n=1 Tax=Oceaniovalibus guishaninsula JLT2003 TaxID=1231392 RepID=K2HM57_9RHOB|nr:DmsC/YnfH family molybdoenzyme membrane anchor subunit [Oceaniovalibus guishaninsula]EKE43969.1 dimethyl sulfoxide reductase, C subunit, putative [Oceaniovalibus guishaninsula JLT2003]
MHPAPSLIAFSTLSGLGLGLLAMLGLGLAPVAGLTGLVFFALAFALAGGGLLSSALHLGHPERALKAFTQWRSSWLSREAWLAVTALAVMATYAALAILAGIVVPPLGGLGAALSLGTVFATAMIYAQLRTVPRWHHWSTPALFLGYAIAGGTLLSGHVGPAAILLAAMSAAQIAAWVAGDARLAASGTDIATATGLGGRGAVRLFEPPHTGGNYLTHEMVFRVARRHAVKLRVIALLLAFAVPVAFLLLPFGHILAALAVLSHAAGVAVQRWLFFAEAEHVVGFYYGRRLP